MKPMLAKKHPAGEVPVGDYLYELKFDGVRAVFEFDGDSVTIFSRNGREITPQFPELVASAPTILTRPGTYDGEIIVTDEHGRPDFARITSRFHLKQPGAQDLEQNPVTAVLFDMVANAHRSLAYLPLEKRLDHLYRSVAKADHWQLSVIHSDGRRLYDYAEQNGLEGIMAKRRDSAYNPGGRTSDWLKVKVMHTETVMVVGFTEGKGKRLGVFGSFVIQDMKGRLIGNVGTGFTDEELQRYMDHFKAIGYHLHTDGKYFELSRPLLATVKGMKKNTSGAIREPVFVAFQR